MKSTITLQDISTSFISLILSGTKDNHIETEQQKSHFDLRKYENGSLFKICYGRTIFYTFNDDGVAYAITPSGKFFYNLFNAQQIQILKRYVYNS